MTSVRDLTCPLCGSDGPFGHRVDIRRRHHRVCPDCRLIFVKSHYLPEPAEEESRYHFHQNDADDAPYVEFLQQAVTPALPLLQPGMHGLDFGSGKVPVLPELLAAHGLRCDVYDPFFFPELPERTFDFLFATEVIEHFYYPARDWNRMISLLNPGGILVAMTAPWTEEIDFPLWGYASDRTHVAFYHEATLAWIARAFAVERLDSGNPRVALYRRPA